MRLIEFRTIAAGLRARRTGHGGRQLGGRYAVARARCASRRHLRAGQASAPAARDPHHVARRASTPIEPPASSLERGSATRGRSQRRCSRTACPGEHLAPRGSSSGRRVTLPRTSTAGRTRLLRSAGCGPAGSPALYERRIGDNHHHLVCTRCDAVHGHRLRHRRGPVPRPVRHAGFADPHRRGHLLGPLRRLPRAQRRRRRPTSSRSELPSAVVTCGLRPAAIPAPRCADATAVGAAIRRPVEPPTADSTTEREGRHVGPHDDADRNPRRQRRALAHGRRRRRDRAARPLPGREARPVQPRAHPGAHRAREGRRRVRTASR